MVQKIRDDLEGVVYVPDQVGVTLKAGDEVPEGVKLGDHLLAAASPKPESDEGEGDGKSLEESTVAELRELAADQGVELGDATKKADIIAAIKASVDDDSSAD